MSKVTLGHEIIGFDDAFDVIAMHFDGDAHNHVLWAFCDASIDTKEVRSFKRLETKAESHLELYESVRGSHLQVVAKVTVVDNGRVEHLSVILDNIIDFFGNHSGGLVVLGIDVSVEVFDDCRETFLGFFVEIGDGNARRQDRVVRVFGGEICSGLCGKILDDIGSRQ